MASEVLLNVGNVQRTFDLNYGNSIITYIKWQKPIFIMTKIIIINNKIIIVIFFKKFMIHIIVILLQIISG